MKTFDDVYRLMEAVSDLDWDVHWTTSQGEVVCYINCNDLFEWALAEGEEINPEDIDAMRAADADARAAQAMAWAPELFVARKRGMRPQGAVYKSMQPGAVALFNACGPHRPADLCNPIATPEVGGDCESHPLDRLPDNV